MRIWLQSGAAVGTDLLWEPYERVLRSHAQKIARPGNTVDLHGVKQMTTAVDRSYYLSTLSTLQVVDSAIKAEEEGYDAFALTSMLDLGFFELREVVNIPVVLSLETTCHIASLLAPKFALLGYNEISIRRLTELIKHYGLSERFVVGGSFTTTLEALQEGFKDPEPVLKGAIQVARKVREQGADMLISTCACLNMILVANGIREIEGIPVIDSVGTAIKTAELLIDLKGIGIDRVNRSLYSRLKKEELVTILNRRARDR
jgi:Asp/Glu/hydantoin racemase